MFDDDKSATQEPGFYRFGDFAPREAPASDPHESANAGLDEHDAHEDEDERAEADEAPAAGLDHGGPEAPHVESEIEQVRDILFGAAQRATDERLREIEDSLGALRSDMMRLFADLEARMADGDAAVERRHAFATQGIGSALSEIGAQILKLPGRNGG